MKVEILPATREHVDAIAANPRQADEDEVRASCGLSVGWALRYGLRRSTHAWTAVMDGEPVCVFGISLTSAITGSGAVWCLGSKAMERREVQREFVRHSPAILEDLQRRYRGTLFNCVDVRNTMAIRWLRWMGFTLLDPVTAGRNGELFRPFYIRS